MALKSLKTSLTTDKNGLNNQFKAVYTAIGSVRSPKSVTQLSLWRPTLC